MTVPVSSMDPLLGMSERVLIGLIVDHPVFRVQGGIFAISSGLSPSDPQKVSRSSRSVDDVGP